MQLSRNLLWISAGVESRGSSRDECCESEVKYHVELQGKDGIWWRSMEYRARISMEYRIWSIMGYLGVSWGYLIGVWKQRSHLEHRGYGVYKNLT